MRDEHLRLRDLADRRDGLLTGARKSAADAHLATGCDVCSAASLRLAGALGALADGPLPAPPRAAVRDALRMFRAKKWAWLLEAPGRIVARLVLDQRMDLVPALRSAGGSQRRMLWSVGRHELDACIVESATKAEVMGQVLPAEDDGTTAVVGEVEALLGGRSVARATLDNDGRFAFRGLRHGTYALLGRVGDDEFVLAPVEIGAGA